MQSCKMRRNEPGKQREIRGGELAENIFGKSSRHQVMMVAWCWHPISRRASSQTLVTGLRWLGLPSDGDVLGTEMCKCLGHKSKTPT